MQEECGADIYLQDGTLHIHPPGEKMGVECFYDFSLNVEEDNLTYHVPRTKGAGHREGTDA